MTTNVSNTVMRRVYYTYVLRLALHPVSLHGIFLVLCVALLAQFVSFYNVFLNILDVRVGDVGSYVMDSLLHTELWTVVLIGMVTVNVVLFSIRTMRSHRYTVAA